MKKIYLSSPTMYGDEQRFVAEAFDTNWVAPLGPNVNAFEKEMVEYTGCGHAAALSAGTAALHLAMKCLNIGPGDVVFSSDLTFAATCNPVTYENGTLVFIDSEYDTWNMDPEALKKAYEKYPNPKAIVMAHLYGTPSRIDELMAIAREHGTPVIEDAAEALSSTYKGRQCGTFGDIGIYSFNGNKIITTSGGGMMVSKNEEYTKFAVFLSTQARDPARYYQHSHIGYNYRMSNIVAGVIRGQLPYLDEHIARKAEIYNRYKEGFKGLPVHVNPYDEENSIPNFWLSCMIIDEDAMCKQVRDDHKALYIHEKGKSCPTEILEKLEECNMEGRPIWKPMHAQPIYRTNKFVTANGNGRGQSNAYIDLGKAKDVGMDIFNRGLCLPSDIKMTKEEQDMVIATIRECFEM